MNERRKIDYDITAQFDDGLYKIVNDEWVLIQRHHKPKTVDLRHAFAFVASETYQKDAKMDRFKRFLPIFAKFFASCVACSVLFAGVLVGGAYLDEVFGFPAGLIAVVVSLFGGASALIAWVESGTRG